MKCGCGRKVYVSSPGCHESQICLEHGLVGVWFPPSGPCTHARFLSPHLTYVAAG